MDRDSLTLSEPSITVALPTLCAVTVDLRSATRLRFKHADGTVQTKIADYRPAIRKAVTEFLRRKLPPSVVFTLDEEGPFPGWTTL
jgi:hypothetical protein